MLTCERLHAWWCVLLVLVWLDPGVRGTATTTTPSVTTTLPTQNLSTTTAWTTRLPRAALTPPHDSCPGEWFCGMGIEDGVSKPECLPKEFRCDGAVDCTVSPNDESNCDETCHANQTACADGSCIPTVFVCDRVQDCPKDEEESNCTYPVCGPGQFSCANMRHCIPKSSVCDKIIDCGDKSDEADTLCLPPACSAGRFMCKDKKCIAQNLVCSGSAECDDGTDEDKGCGVDECKDQTHNCSNTCTNINIGYNCGCKPGYELMADKHTCQDIDECKKTPLFCSQFCTNTQGSFSCSCADGYALTADKMLCRKTDSIEPTLIIANRFQIRHLSINGVALGRANEENEYTHVLDFDWASETIYFADAGKRQMKKMNFNGSNEEIVIRHNLPLVEGIAVDWVNEKLYWTDSAMAALFVANMNGTYVTKLQSERIKLPRAIIVHPARGWLYWTDWTLGAYIGRIGMDGSNMVKLIEEGLFWPNALTIDYITERIWWADAHLDKIETALIDGTQRYAVIESLPHIYGINIFEEWMYWTDWNIKTIEKANRFTGLNRQQLAKMNHQPYDIHVLHPLRQNPSTVNPCDGDNGGCSHLCLLAPSSVYGKPSFSCACPDHFILKPDNKTCRADCNEKSQFECGRDDHRCISKRWLCDGSKDCAGGEDELNCPAVIQCDPGMFACGNGKCVRDPRDVCDEVDDCGDDTDENKTMCEDRACLPSEFRCSTGQCISQKWKCDDDPDCPNEDDEDGCDIVRECNVDEFQCGNGKCIPKLWVCDIDDDCGDSTDEVRPNCTGECRHGWQKCKRNYRCVPKLMFCDGDDDCRDNSDEDPDFCPVCGNGEWQCNNEKCIPDRWRCDFQDDCGDNSDENVTRCTTDNKYPPCEENEFRCQNSKCIRERYKCDLDDDCMDGSDELNCAEHTCIDGLWQCRSGHCILESFKCDAVKHCVDLSDESDCPTRFPNGSYCPPEEFECKTSICIPPSWICDADDDCGDRSDEEPALCAAHLCNEEKRFRCANNYCIHRSLTCDGVDDCGDASDENNFTVCPPKIKICESGDFRCTNRDCIPAEKVCNGMKDCADRSDELACHTGGTGVCSDHNGGCEKVCEELAQNRYFCHCNSTGLRIDPANKKLCIDVNECESWRTNNCDQTCVNTDGDFKCKCAANFTAIPHPTGKTCRASLAESSILISMENNIRQVRLPHNTYTDVVVTRSAVRAIDVDGANNLVYWTDNMRNTVFRSWVPKTGTEISQPQDLELYPMDIVPEGIAIDWVAGNMYITDSKNGKILVGKTDGRYMKTIISESFRQPTRIALSPQLGLIFWVDSVNKKIESAWMDGTNINTVVTVNISDPTSIAVDHYMKSRLFWVDLKRHVIESANVDGTDRVIVAHQAYSYPFALDVFETKVYWISQRNQTLTQYDKFGRGVNVSHPIQSNLQYPQDIKVMNLQKQPADVTLNRCKDKGCTPLCVLIPDGARCLCPDGSNLKSPNTCNSPFVAARPMPKSCSCYNGGTCAIDPGDFRVYCLCKPDFIGDACEIDTKTTTATTTTSTTSTTTTTQRPTTTTTLTTLMLPSVTVPSNQERNNVVAVLIPIIVIIIVLAIIIIILFVLYRRGLLRRKSHGVFREGLPGQENGVSAPPYEIPTVKYDAQGGGNVDAGFNNRYYEVVDIQSQQKTEELPEHTYASIGDMKS